MKAIAAEGREVSSAAPFFFCHTRSEGGLVHTTHSLQEEVENHLAEEAEDKQKMSSASFDPSTLHDPRLFPAARDMTATEFVSEEDDGAVPDEDVDDEEEDGFVKSKSELEEEAEAKRRKVEWDGVSTGGPVVALLIGMAGSGKSTLFHRMYYDAAEDPLKARKRCYFINLDPATLETPIEAHIDIRDTVDYKGVMREYNLGPNGAIVTCLNLFATQFNEVMGILEKRALDFDYVIVDTPGQIEAFTWSASGQLVAETLASTFATAVVYVVDTPRSRSPATFMSNMVYACSILHKYQLPLIAAFNKADVADPTLDCFRWMDDFEEFHEALDDAENSGESYVTSLHRSMSLVLDEFYRVLDRVAVSAADGTGVDDLWKHLENAKIHYDKTYGNEIRRRIKERHDTTQQHRHHNQQKLAFDITGGKKTSEENNDTDDAASRQLRTQQGQTPPHYDPSLTKRLQRPDAKMPKQTIRKLPGTASTSIPEKTTEEEEDYDEEETLEEQGDDDDDDTLPPGQDPGQPSPLPMGVGTSEPRATAQYRRGVAPPIVRKKGGEPSSS